jgi:hypothetical protein
VGILITLLEMGPPSVPSPLSSAPMPGENGIMIMSHDRTLVKKTGPVIPNNSIIVDYFDRGFHYAKP